MTDRYTRTIRISRTVHQMAVFLAAQTEGVSSVHQYVEELIKSDWEAVAGKAKELQVAGNRVRVGPGLMKDLRYVARKLGNTMHETMERATADQAAKRGAE